jgi:hypothetical protein
VVSATETYTTFIIQFEIEKVINSPKTLPKALIIRDSEWFQNPGTCSKSSKLVSRNHSNGELSLNTKKFIVILDTSALPSVQSVWYGGYPVEWSEKEERYIDSLSKLAIKTSVYEVPTQMKFAVYPSPTQTHAILKYFVNRVGEVQVDIFNYQGQVIQSQLVRSQAGENIEEINVSTFSNGVYFVRVRHQDGIQTQHLVVQR